MLVSFSVKNYRSYAERQTLSMVAGVSSRKNENLSFQTGNALAPDVLRSACLFGANGSGKTSLVKAMDFFRDFVISSAKDRTAGEEIDVNCNLLVDEFNEQPSEFEAIFIHESVLYQYGFATDRKRVWGEWLFAKPNTDKARLRTLFQREFDSNSSEDRWKINDTFIRGQKENWKEATRPNSLFLSHAVQQNSEDLKKPFNWIQKCFRPVAGEFGHGFSARQCSENAGKEKILNLLQSVDLRIRDISVEEEELSLADLPHDMPQAIKDMIFSSNKKKITQQKVFSYHQRNSGEMIPLNFKDESDGTRQLFALAGPLFDVLENGYTLVVDELDKSLHPHALKMLVSLFHDPKINKNNGQLIFTSHSPSIMSKGFMHQDQVWLAERNDDESTELIPLSDFRVRDVNNFHKAYLDGRFGGVPRLKEFTDVE